MVKMTMLVPVPKVFTTLIGPVVAAAGTIAVICVVESMLKEAAARPLKRTAETPAKLEPEITTTESGAPLAGEKLKITGIPSPERTPTVTGDELVAKDSLSVALAVRT
jgi:hypothetical protein